MAAPAPPPPPPRLAALLWTLLASLLLALGPHPARGQCSRPLGLTSGAVRDWQLSASSSLGPEIDPECHARFGRLHQARGRAWCARTPAHDHWLLVDLGVTAQITGVMTQGRAERPEWTTSYHLSYSQDAFRWDYVFDADGKRKVFPGNRDSHTVRHNYLEPALEARFVRVHALDWVGAQPSLRLELVGCQGTLLEQTECNQLVSVAPYTKVTASSHPSWARKTSCQPQDSEIFGHRAWCPRHQDPHQWLQFDLGPPILVVGVTTRGRPDTKRLQWTSAYYLTYSNDSLVWYSYKEGNHLHPKLFGGNMDRGTERRHYLNAPFTARFVRVQPASWSQAIGLRAALIGCPHRGPCPPGYLRVTPSARCVPNLAYAKTTWVNDKRHGWKDWTYGNSALAVDGDYDASLPRCAILDNYYVEQPLWMVDLGWQEPVLGVVVTTWQGVGQDKNIPYHDYLLNLDRFTVYVSDRPRLEAYQLSPVPDANVSRCAAVSRARSAVFQPRLHFDCGRTLTGRYVYVKAAGVANRWKQMFSAVLCEVEVY